MPVKHYIDAELVDPVCLCDDPKTCTNKKCDKKRLFDALKARADVLDADIVHTRPSWSWKP